MSNPPADTTPAAVRAAPVPHDRCGMALACDVLGDRWTMLILREAFYGVARFDDLRADLGIPRGVLSARLKKLVAEGVLDKLPYREGAARVRHEYRLSAAGRELGLTILALMQWGDRHLQHAPSPLAVTDASTGLPLTVALVTPEGRAVAVDAVRIEVTMDEGADRPTRAQTSAARDRR
jgi:DNA-binding HxlR family transcriptional regulator